MTNIFYKKFRFKLTILSRNAMKDCTNTIMVQANFQIARQQGGKNTGQRIEIMYVHTRRLKKKQPTNFYNLLCLSMCIYKMTK